MKNILILLFVGFFSAFLNAQKIDYIRGTAYSTSNPTARPTNARPYQLWKNTATGILWVWDNANSVWSRQNPEYYGEMGIENDTLTLGFAATTADTLEGVTAGLLNGFALDGDFSIRYTGEKQGRFLLNYSTSFTFAEAGTITSYVKQNTTIVYKSKRRQIVATAGNNVTSSGNCLLTLQPGDRILLFFQPTTHTGSDDLTVYECNVSLTQLK